MPIRGGRLAALALIGTLIAGCGDGGDGAADQVTVPSAQSVWSTTVPSETFVPPPTTMSFDEIDVTFSVGSSLPELPTEAGGSVFAAGRTVDLPTVERLAGAFGIDADPRHLDDEYGSRWLIGSASPEEPTLWVIDAAPHNFEFSLPHRTVDMAGCDTSAWASTVPGEVAPGCEDLLLPPPGLPDATTAESRARDILAASGVDADAYGYDVVEDERETKVRAFPGGLDSVADWRFTFDGRDLPAHVTGVVDEPAPSGPYELIDLDTALQRLAEVAAAGWTYGDGRSIADTDPAYYPTSVPPFPGDQRPDDDGELEVVLADVRLDHIASWTSDGSVVMLPAYRFVSDSGYEKLVRAVTADVLEAHSFEPPPFPLLRDRAGLDDLVGETVDAFTDRADDLGYTSRVVSEDGEQLDGTDDYRPDRANVEVADGVVVAISSIG